MDKNFYNLLQNDEYGLLNDTQKNTPVTENDRVIDSFLEIVNFYEENKRLPNLYEVHERKLAVRLKTFIENIDQYNFILEYDKFNLLKESENKGVDEDIMGDEFGLLDLSDDHYSISKMINVPQREIINKAEFIAKRTPIKDFSPFEEIFNNIKNKINNGTVFYTSDISRENVKVGTFFVLNGIVGLVKEIDELQKNEQRKFNARTRVIFDNHTESNMLFRTLIDSLHKDNGKIISFYEISDSDMYSGYIYILKSLSQDPQIQNIQDLYKIGFSTAEVEERIKNAEVDPTYLMSKVKLVEKIKCYNLDAHRFERLIHRFFNEVCIDMIISDVNGNHYNPKEWFSAPLNVIEEAIDLIISGEIINYEYDKFQKIIKKKQLTK